MASKITHFEATTTPLPAAQAHHDQVQAAQRELKESIEAFASLVKISVKDLPLERQKALEILYNAVAEAHQELVSLG